MENLQSIITPLKNGQVGVLPTDTIYGIVGSALNQKTVEKIYKLRKRARSKPMIILLFDLNYLNHFNISLTEKQVKFLKKIWPNPVSVVLECKSEHFKYLHRGTNSLAFRVPKDERLLSILKEVGPVVAPSANFQVEKPSETIDEARKYFGDSVFYVDGGKVESQPSTLISLNQDGSYKILREGNFRL